MSPPVRAAFLVLAFLLGQSVCHGEDFAIRDGDTVVFLGDSITAARTYGKIIENYTLLRYPQRKVRFINAGAGGDTAAGGLDRLQRDVFDAGATLVTVAYGTNDIGWGARADEAHKQKYIAAIREIVTRCHERKVRVYVCSAAVTAADPETSEESFLQKMCDEGMQISRSLGEGAIDVQRRMREVQKRVAVYNRKIVKDPAKAVSLHVADGVHLSDLGQLAMAFAILKGLSAPAEVSSVTLDPSRPEAIEAKGCKVTNVALKDERLEFDRLDEGLPLTLGLFGALSYLHVPIHDELARYMLAVQNLPAKTKFELQVDGRPLGGFTAEQLARGINISFATADPWQPGGPWDVQANQLKHLTESRHELLLSKWTGQRFLDGAAVADWNQTADDLNARLEQLQRVTARPRTYHFVLRPMDK